jgi:hypothetical protein
MKPFAVSNTELIRIALQMIPRRHTADSRAEVPHQLLICIKDAKCTVKWYSGSRKILEVKIPPFGQIHAHLFVIPYRMRRRRQYADTTKRFAQAGLCSQLRRIREFLLQTGAACPCETFVVAYQSTWRKIPKDSSLQMFISICISDVLSTSSISYTSTHITE